MWVTHNAFDFKLTTSSVRQEKENIYIVLTQQIIVDKLVIDTFVEMLM